MPNKPKKINLPLPKKQHTPRPQYGSLHQKLRVIVLNKNPLCQHCKKQFSEHAHHLIPNATKPEHYMAVCQECHREIHRDE